MSWEASSTAIPSAFDAEFDDDGSVLDLGGGGDGVTGASQASEVVPCSDSTQALQLMCQQPSQDDTDEDEIEKEAEKLRLERLQPPPPPACQPYYERKSNSKPVLFAMCIGLTSMDGKRKLFDITEEPHGNISTKSTCHCSGQAMKDEVKRRCHQLKLPKKECPRPDNYNNKRLRQWLEDHPIVSEHDIRFLVKEEARVRDVPLAGLKDKQKQEEAKIADSKWTSWHPHVRLYLAICSDKARTALLNEDDCEEREETDARNTDIRPKTFFEVVAEIYNDPAWIPTADALPDLHESFKEPVDPPFHEMQGGEITAADVKSRYYDAKAKVTQIIFDWEKSGNGMGQRSTKDSSWGTFTTEHLELEDGDNRANFAKEHQGHRWHHLYPWDLSDKLQILSNVITVLSRPVAASSSEEPASTSDVQRARKKRKAVPADVTVSSTAGTESSALAEQEETTNAFKGMIGCSVTSMAITARKQHLLSLTKAHEEYAIKAITSKAKDEPIALQEFFKDCRDRKLKEADDTRKEIAEMEEQYNSVFV